MTTNFILLDAAAGSAGFLNIAMIILVVIFYFFMIRPQQKKQKELRKFREALTTGDNVVTAGGIYGKIRRVKDTTFVVEVANGVSITIDKNSVYPSAQDALSDAEAEQKNINK